VSYFESSSSYTKELEARMQVLQDEFTKVQQQYFEMQHLLCMAIYHRGAITLTPAMIESMPAKGNLITSVDKESGGVTVMFEEETT
jgi:hypothetical protein